VIANMNCKSKISNAVVVSKFILTSKNLRNTWLCICNYVLRFTGDFLKPMSL